MKPIENKENLKIKLEAIEHYSFMLEPIFQPNSTYLKKHFIKILTNKENLNPILEKLNKDRNLEKNDYLYPIAQKNTKKVHNIMELYYEYHNLFKTTSNLRQDNKRFNIIEENNLEIILDKMKYHIEQSELRQYAKSFVKGYKELLNEESLMIFKALKEEEIPRDIIQKEIRKIAAFKSSEDLNLALKKILNHTSLYEEKIKRILENECKDSKIIYQKEGITIVEVGSFKDAQELGTSQWCISYDEDYYEEYLRKINLETLRLSHWEEKTLIDTFEEEVFGINNVHLYAGGDFGNGDAFEGVIETENKGKHYFLYNDNLNKEDNEAMIAFTIGANEEIQYCFDKEDNEISVENIQKKDFIQKFLKEKNKKIKSFNLEEVSEEVHKYLSIEETLSPFTVLSETRNPLAIYTNIIKNSHTRPESLFIINTLFEKSANDVLNFKEITPEKYIEDVLFLNKFIKSKYKITQKKFYEENNLKNKVFTEALPFKNILEKEYFQKILNKIDKEDRNIILKEINKKQKIRNKTL